MKRNSSYRYTKTVREMVEGQRQNKLKKKKIAKDTNIR